MVNFIALLSLGQFFIVSKLLNLFTFDNERIY